MTAQHGAGGGVLGSQRENSPESLGDVYFLCRRLEADSKFKTNA